ncbi:MAG: hypothetical protein ACOX2U_02690 [Limisphaerales bacterium]|mgnify:FL=1|jgi:hypothetical protein|nr:hypothetical protein [Verrucomicrobiota bacterium]
MQRETGQVERMGSWLHPCGRSLKRGAALLLLVVLAPLAMALSDLSAPQKPTYEIAPQELEELSPVVYKESYGRSGPIVFNHQSALWEQVVLVVNNSSSDWGAVLLLVSDVEGASVYNALHAGGGTYELIHNHSVPADGGMVKFVVEYRADDPAEGMKGEPGFFFRPTTKEERNVAAPGSKPVRTTLEVQPLGVGYYSVDLPSSIDVDVPEAWSLPLSPYEVGGWASIGVMLSFDTRPGEVYEIQFSDDGKTWQPAMPHLQASGVQAFWIDKGAPKTPTHPMLTIVPGGIPAPLRLYRVVELPGLPQ